MNAITKNKFLIKSKLLSRKGLYDFLSENYKLIPAGSEVLTIGAGGGVNSLLDKFAHENNFKVYSFDVDQEKKPDILGDLCTYDFLDKKFDVVVCSEVIEHLHSPHMGINNIYSILKSGGKLILSTPFIFPLHDRPHDYYRFTKYGLEYLLKNFNRVEIRERNSYFEAIDVLWVRLIQAKSDNALILCRLLFPVIFYLKSPLSNLLSKIVKIDDMTTGYVATAVK
jgi:SAM-dependent methyltransferase